jgi:hypothetical protein
MGKNAGKTPKYNFPGLAAVESTIRENISKYVVIRGVE